MTTKDTTCRSCAGSIIFPDGEHRCYRHASNEDKALVEDLDRRGRRIGVGTSEDGRWGHWLAWPYGPNIDVRMRRDMCTWAEEHNLRYLPRGGRGPKRLAADGHVIRGPWLDHVTWWGSQGKRRGPAHLVAHPYSLNPDDLAELHGIDKTPNLDVEIRSDGWYGYGTYMVTVWQQVAS